MDVDEDAVAIATVEHRTSYRTLYDAEWDLWEDVSRQSPVLCSAVSPRGELIALGLEDGTITIWDLRTIAILVREFAAPGRARVGALCWSRASTEIVAAYDGLGAVGFWRVESGAAEHAEPRAVVAVPALASCRNIDAATDGTIVACAAHGVEVVAIEDGVSTSLDEFLPECLAEAPYTLKGDSGAEALFVGNMLVVVLPNWTAHVLERCDADADHGGRRRAWRVVHSLDETACSPATGLKTFIIEHPQPSLIASGGVVCVCGGLYLRVWEASTAREVARCGEAALKMEREIVREQRLVWATAAFGGEGENETLFGVARGVHAWRLNAQAPGRGGPEAGKQMPLANNRLIKAVAWRRGSRARRSDGDARAGVAPPESDGELFAVDYFGDVQRRRSQLRTTWAGAMFPVGYMRLEDNIDYIEEEDECDVVGGLDAVPASSTDLANVDGYTASLKDDVATAASEAGRFEAVDVVGRSGADIFAEPAPCISPLKRLRPSLKPANAAVADAVDRTKVSAKIDADAARIRQLLAVDKA
ncbi:hypothetical protein M885DRAFT_508233 [Pelagophyceae sp. CCMP2097]|nr:hypothetical protein M885DRAFT_508233 [Pelagophyceae sp. CCMP2097]